MTIRYSLFRPSVLFLFFISTALHQPPAEEPKANVPPSALIQILLTDKNPETLSTVAQQLGDLAIEKKLSLSAQEDRKLNILVQGYLKQAKSVRTRKRAEEQLLRLWHVALPGLLQGLDSLGTFSESVRIMTMMKSEHVIKALITKTQQNKNPQKASLLRLALTHMKTYRKPSIKERPGISEQESTALNKKWIEPALENEDTE